VISEALNFAVESPEETTRFLEGVAADSVLAERPMFEAQVAAYRDNPTTPEVRRRMGLTLLADVILETKATPEECAVALRDLGCQAVVRSVANQVLEYKNNFVPGEHVSVGEKATIPDPPVSISSGQPPPSTEPRLTPRSDRVELADPVSPSSSQKITAPQFGQGGPSASTPTGEGPPRLLASPSSLRSITLAPWR